MDKVKVILKHLQRHHFWLLCVVAVVACLVGWSSASRSLSAVFTDKKAKIHSKFSELKTIRDVEKPPNSKWKTEIAKLTEDQTSKVETAWKTAYEKQKELLQWPADLGKDFLDFIAERPNDPIPRNMLNRYNAVVPEEFHKLLKLVDAQPAGPDLARGSGGVPTEPTEVTVDSTKEYTVVWDDQREAAQLFGWEEVPSNAMVRRAQEDLWVYTALLSMIADMNKGVHVPRVKKISALQIGKPAASALEEGLKPGHLSNASVGAAEPAASIQMSEPNPGGEAAKPADEGRYVDIEGKAVPGELAAKSPFKGLPVYMKLQMDQREIGRLLTECANSPLPVDVTQLRINPGGRINARPTRLPQASRPANTPAPVEPDPFDIPVELCGIIYIFNPPNMANVSDNLVVKTKRGARGGASP